MFEGSGEDGIKERLIDNLRTSSEFWKAHFD